MGILAFFVMEEILEEVGTLGGIRNTHNSLYVIHPQTDNYNKGTIPRSLPVTASFIVKPL